MVFKPFSKKVEAKPIEQVQEIQVAPQIIKTSTPKEKEITRVVKELPVQEVRKIVDADGTIVNLITIEEALEAMLNQIE